MFAVVTPPAVIAHEHPGPTKGELKRQRQRELAGVDPDGDILPLEMTNKAYGSYRERLLAINPTCIYCGDKLKSATATLDHGIPRSKGGLNQPWNLWLSCKACNAAKRDRTVLEWLDDLIDACRIMGLIRDDDTIIVELTEGGVA